MALQDSQQTDLWTGKLVKAPSRLGTTINEGDLGMVIRDYNTALVLVQWKERCLIHAKKTLLMVQE